MTSRRKLELWDHSDFWNIYEVLYHSPPGINREIIWDAQNQLKQLYRNHFLL